MFLWGRTGFKGVYGWREAIANGSEMGVDEGYDGLLVARGRERVLSGKGSMREDGY